MFANNNAAPRAPVIPHTAKNKNEIAISPQLKTMFASAAREPVKAESPAPVTPSPRHRLNTATNTLTGRSQPNTVYVTYKPITPPATNAPAEISQLFLMSQRIQAPAIAPVATADAVASAASSTTRSPGLRSGGGIVGDSL